MLEVKSQANSEEIFKQNQRHFWLKPLAFNCIVSCQQLCKMQKCNFIGWMRSVKMIEYIDILMAMQMQQTLFNDVILVENNVP